MPKPHAHLQNMTKESAQFPIDQYKTIDQYKELRTQGTHGSTLSFYLSPKYYSKVEISNKY